MLKPNIPTLAVLVLSAALAATASIALAQESGKPAGTPDKGMMGGRGDGMMEMMKGVDPAEMKRMVENCNRMMESMMQNMPTAPNAPATPPPDKKG
jgi:hypothetical protein